MNPVSSRATASRTDRVLLEGPHSRRKELWLVLRAFADFIQGFRTLHFVGPCVTVFGSARYGESHPLYELGRDVGRGVTELGFTAMTGGGPGLMEAVNRGAREAGDRTFSVVLIGTAYWRPLQDLLRHLAAARTIDERDLELLLVTDSVSAALEHIQRHAVEPFGLVRRHLRPSTWLGERTVMQRPPTRAPQNTDTPIAPSAA